MMETPGKKVRRSFSLRDRGKSFKSSFDGLKLLLKFEHNFRIHLVVLLLVVVAGAVFRISPVEWIAVVLVSGFVLSSEALNTAVEYMSDAFSSGFNPEIKRIKDVAAAGVLISAVTALVTGLIIFLPRLLALFSSKGP